MRGLWPLLIPTFAAGFGVAWWLKSDPPPPVEVETANSPKVVPRRPGETVTVRPNGTDTGSKLTGLTEAVYDDEFEGQLAMIEASEIPKLLAQLGERSGFLGLDYEDEDVLEKLLQRWYDLEPEAALLWTLDLGNPKDRRELLDTLILHQAESDLDQAMEMVRAHARDEDGEIDVPLSLLDYALEQSVDDGAEKLLEVCRLGIAKDDGYSGTSLEYPEGFAFEELLNSLADLGDSLSEGQGLSLVPSNLLSEWASRDPEAAYAWLEAGREVPFNSEFSDFMEGYAAVATDVELGEFAAGVYVANRDAGDPYESVFEALSAIPEAGVVESFLESLGGDAVREAHLRGLLEHSESTWGGPYDELRDEIVVAMRPETRLEMFMAKGLDHDTRQELAPLLRRLGHTEAEVAAMTAE